MESSFNLDQIWKFALILQKRNQYKRLFISLNRQPTIRPPDCIPGVIFRSQVHFQLSIVLSCQSCNTKVGNEKYAECKKTILDYFQSIPTSYLE